MKQTWKKMAGLMLASVCAFSLAACGSQEEAGGFQRITDEMAENCVTVSQQAVESLASFDESQLAQMEVSRDDFTRYAVGEWEDATATMGAFQSMGEASLEVNEDENTVTVSIPADFENEEGTLTFVYNYNHDYDQMVPAYMTVAEKETVSGNLRSAGINTVMGVGTVFVVLLFLVFVISLFKYVGKIGSGEEKKETEKKTPAAPAQPAAPAPAPAPAAVQETNMDDVEMALVLATAIAAYEDGNSTDGYVVRSIRKVNKSKWRNA